METFGRGLTVDTVLEQLVWVHSDGSTEECTVSTEYFVQNNPAHSGLSYIQYFCTLFTCFTSTKGLAVSYLFFVE